MAMRPADRINGLLKKHGYTQIKKVGAGSFGQAILVQHDDDKDRDVKAIIKMIDISRASPQEKQDALKESKVLASLKHPYIVKYRESFLEDGWLCISMDYCEGGDLSDRIKAANKQMKPFPEEQVLRWFTQAMLSLKYIHDKHILHRDLKSGNFFLTKNGNLKMGDFGIAKVLECTAACAQTQIGTPYYLSPEICKGEAYAWGSDIWSMGCILYEMCARRVPFDAPDLKALVQRITRDRAPQLPSSYSSGLRDLCAEMLSRDPSSRPSAAEILKKPIVQVVVKKMLEEVQPEGGDGSRPSVPSSNVSKASEQKASPGGSYAGSAGRYKKDDLVEYYSETHQEWLPAQVTDVDHSGRIMINLKPNAWISLEVQAGKVRPRKTENGAPGRPSSQGAGTPKRHATPQRQGTPQRAGSQQGFARPPAGDAGTPRSGRPQSGFAGASPRRLSEQRRPESRGAANPMNGGYQRQGSQDRVPAARHASPMHRDGSRDALGRGESPRQQWGGQANGLYRSPSQERGAFGRQPSQERGVRQPSPRGNAAPMQRQSSRDRFGIAGPREASPRNAGLVRQNSRDRVAPGTPQRDRPAGATPSGRAGSPFRGAYR